LCERGIWRARGIWLLSLHGPGSLVRRIELRAAATSAIVSHMRGTIRAYQPGDLASILRLWEQLGLVPVGDDGLTLDEAVELISSGIASTLVAEQDGELVGVAVGSVTAAVGWVYRLSVVPGAEGGELAQQLVSELELKLAEGGARKLATAVLEASPLWPRSSGMAIGPRLRCAISSVSYRHSGLPSRQPWRSSAPI
jgi:N-acetylglutamate synthase-like GNAT family acetyltransferase